MKEKKTKADKYTNNVGFVRFVAAVLVILCHSYPISLGRQYSDIVGRLTNKQTHLGNIAVCALFFYAGYFSVGSAKRRVTAQNFFKARIKRVIIPLMAVVGTLTFCVGPILSEFTVQEYFTNAKTYKYLLNMILIPIHKLPGVFEKNIYGNVVNGSLWTLPLEFAGYIAVFALYKLGFLEKQRLIWITLVGSVFYFAYVFLIGLGEYGGMIRPSVMFFEGCAVYVYKDKLIMNKYIFYFLLFALIGAIRSGIYDYVCPIAFPYICIYLGFATHIIPEAFQKLGELSYGMYLCGWPIQQTVVEQWGGRMSPILNFSISIVCAMLCGCIIHFLVERPLRERVC